MARSKRAVDASIIIPSYNSRTTIARCLQALLTQRTKYTHEILVVDSSSDGTGAFVASRFPMVTRIQLSNRTFPGEARNIGIQAAKGEFLAFTDSDCLPAPNWLERMIDELRHGTYAAVGGSVLNGRPENLISWCDYLLEFSERLPSYPRQCVAFLPTCNFSCRRDLFDRYGLFARDLETAEDQTFCWRLIQAGERLLFEPAIRVSHLFRSGFRAFVRHQHWLGRGAAVARRHVALPHAWLLSHPLRWLSPLGRLLVLERRLARQDLRGFVTFNMLLPVCLSGLIAWGIGFCRHNAGHA